MSKNMSDFLKALKKNTDIEVEKIQAGSKPIIHEINEKNQAKISAFLEEQLSASKSRDQLESFQRELSAKQLEWITNVNNKQGKLLEQLFTKLKNSFSALAEEKEIYDLLGKLYDEVKASTGNDFVVHITYNCSPDKFKSKTGVKGNVVADLKNVGIMVERFDIPITIENTLEARMAKVRNELTIMASQNIWGDLDVTPWDINQVLNKLLELSG